MTFVVRRSDFILNLDEKIINTKKTWLDLQCHLLMGKCLLKVISQDTKTTPCFYCKLMYLFMFVNEYLINESVVLLPSLIKFIEKITVTEPEYLPKDYFFWTIFTPIYVSLVLLPSPEVYSGTCQTSMMELFSRNCYRLKIFNYFRKNLNHT